MAAQVPSRERVRVPVGRSRGDPPEARREDGGLTFIGTRGLDSGYLNHRSVIRRGL